MPARRRIDRSDDTDSLESTMSKRSVKRRRAKPVRALKLAPSSRPQPSWRTMPATMIGELDGARSDGVESDGDGRSPAVDALPVILIEDNRLLLEGLMSVLSAQGLKVIATAR